MRNEECRLQILHSPVGRDARIAPGRTDENPAPLPGEPVTDHRVVFFLLLRTISDRLMVKRTPHLVY